MNPPPDDPPQAPQPPSGGGLLSDSRQEAVVRLKHATHEVGGNAVIAMRFDAKEIADVMSEVAANGAAVTMHKS